MDWKRVARKVLNMPEPKTRKPQDADADAWVAAGQKVAQGADTSPWANAEESRARRFWGRFMRGALTVALVVFCWIGIRETFTPADATPPAPQVSTAEEFPTEGAAAIAERFAWAYLTWDQTDPDIRKAALAQVYAGDGGQGWNQTGKQSVARALTADVDVTDATHAQVTVHVLTVPYAKDTAGAWTAGEPVWAGLDVPVRVVDGDVVVSGPPGLVGIPAPVAATEEKPATAGDSSLTSSTRTDVAEAFFTAYAAGDVDAVAAPGAHIPALEPGWELETVKSWTIYQGTDSERQAHAVVTFSREDGTSIDQTYSLTLTSVSGKTGARWQVSAVHGG